jgi:hypothetical protein
MLLLIKGLSMKQTSLSRFVAAILAFFSLFILIFFAGCSSTKQIYSESAAIPYIIDGHSNEWYGKKMVEFKDEGILVGIQNDADYVYICLMSSNRSSSRFMTQAGMILWFEPDGGKKFGIHYPIGRTPQPKDAFESTEASGYTDLDILGPENDAITRSSTLTSENEYGISAACCDSLGTTVIELKIPRKPKQIPYGIMVASGKSVSMNIESGTFQAQSGKRHQHEGDNWTLGNGSSSEEDDLEGGGGMHRKGRPGGGGGYSGHSNIEGQKPPEPISLKLQIRLK